MPVIRVSKMGKCIQKLREERGWSLEELAGGILLSPEEYPKRACRQPVKW